MATGTEALPGGLMRSSSCDVTFELGETYLVFAYGKTLETMKARACSFTGQIHDAGLLELLDGVSPRRPPSPSVRARRLVAVTGSVRNAGTIVWSDGMTVAEAVALAGGAITQGPESAELRFTSIIVRTWARLPRERHPAAPTTPLLPDDELIVAADIRRCP
jgi:hypothetical protein